MRVENLFANDYTDNIIDNTDSIYKKIKLLESNKYFTDRVDINVLKRFNSYINYNNYAGWNTNYNCSPFNYTINYNSYGINYEIKLDELIFNLPIIDFGLLLKNINDENLTFDFIDLFKINKRYSTELSDKIKLGKHDEILDKYVDDLNWETILVNNMPVNNNHIKKYFKYFYNDFSFYVSNKQTFNEEILSFIIEKLFEIITEKSHKENCYYEEIKEKICCIIERHKLTENQLLTITNTIKNIKSIDKSIRDLYLCNILSKIFKTQKFTENFAVSSKLNLFREYKGSTLINGYFSENFIENSKYIDWKVFTKNKYLIKGKYSDEFYIKYEKDIDWKIFKSDLLLDFYKEDKERFKEFFIKFRKKFSSSEVIEFLSCSFTLTNYPFTVDELIKYFKNEILKFKFDRYYCHYLNEEFIIALYRLKHPDFEVYSCLIGLRDRITKTIVKEFKKDIFELLLNNQITETDIVKNINSILEKMKEENKK